jgi:thiamine biosynthesis lipoprotein ApbE
VRGTLAAWACAPDATTADALSTAFMVMSPEEVKQYSMKHGELPAMVMREAKDRKTSPGEVLRFGQWDDIICS